MSTTEKPLTDLDVIFIRAYKQYEFFKDWRPPTSEDYWAGYPDFLLRLIGLKKEQPQLGTTKGETEYTARESEVTQARREELKAYQARYDKFEAECKSEGGHIEQGSCVLPSGQSIPWSEWDSYQASKKSQPSPTQTKPQESPTVPPPNQQPVNSPTTTTTTEPKGAERESRWF